MVANAGEETRLVALLCGMDALPDRPSLDGLEEKWAARWDAAGIYRFDRSRPRSGVFSVDSPPLTVSGSLHIGHVLSYTHTDLVARYQRMCGRSVFYPVAWDDNGLPTERRVQNVFGVRCEPTLPYDPDFRPPSTPDPRRPVPVSRRGFVELCERLSAEDEAVFAAVWRRLGLSVDWSLAYATIDERSRRTAQRAFLDDLDRGDAYRADGPTLWDVDFQTAVAQAELVDREVEGAWYSLDFLGPAGPFSMDTTRPELLPACVAVVVHPGDERYRALVGGTVRTPLFGVEVPVLAHALADPAKGTGLVMVCTFGDLTDVTWWRELALPTRPVVGRDGRLLPHPPHGVPGEPYAELAGLTVVSARAGWRSCCATPARCAVEPRPVRHAVAFYENGRRPLEIAVSGQWYLRNGGRDPALREELLARGRELRWHPPSMRARYEDWVRGLTGDWIVSRQRFFGVPIPLWYRVDTDGMPAYGDPLPARGKPAAGRSRRGPAARVRRGPAGPARRLHRRPGRLRHLGDVLAHPADRRWLGRRPRPVRPGLPVRPAPAVARDHPDLAVRHHPARAHRVGFQNLAMGADLRL